MLRVIRAAQFLKLVLMTLLVKTLLVTIDKGGAQCLRLDGVSNFVVEKRSLLSNLRTELVPLEIA